MGLVSFLCSAIGRSIDIISFMLDLNFCIIHSLVRLLRFLITFINNLPALLVSSLGELWDLALFCVFTVTASMTTAAQSALVGWQQLVGCTSESFKMVGHLSSYVLVRAKELVHRWLLSGHCLLLQIWEAWGITLSLTLYLLNTAVNMVLIATQSCYSAVVWVCEAVCVSLQKAVELVLVLCTVLYSGALSVTVLLWTPCQFALEFLCSLAHVFISVFLLNAYGLALSVGVVLAATLYLNGDLPQLAVRRVLRYVRGVPALCRLQRALHRLHRALHRLYPLARERAQSVLEMGVWMQRGGGGGGGGAAEGRNRGASEGARLLVPAVQPGPSTGGGGGGTAGGRSQQEEKAASSLKLPGVSAGDCRSRPVDSLLTLLKEQEDQKKCVICQDSKKTVLLLPCRHLCLCSDCANLLLSQPVYLHNCPLCRHMILRTMDVYL